MLTRYYYLRDISAKNPREPIGCVCLIYDRKRNVFHRGISLCNPIDKFDKKRARGLAYSRAIKALGNELLTLDAYSKIELPVDWKNSKMDIIRKLESLMRDDSPYVGIFQPERSDDSGLFCHLPLFKQNIDPLDLNPFERRMWDDALKTDK